MKGVSLYPRRSPSYSGNLWCILSNRHCPASRIRPFKRRESRLVEEFNNPFNICSVYFNFLIDRFSRNYGNTVIENDQAIIKACKTTCPGVINQHRRSRGRRHRRGFRAKTACCRYESNDQDYVYRPPRFYINPPFFSWKSTVLAFVISEQHLFWRILLLPCAREGHLQEP